MRRRDFLKAALALPLLPVIAQADPVFMGVDWAAKGTDRSEQYLVITANAQAACSMDFTVFYQVEDRLEVTKTSYDGIMNMQPGDEILLAKIPLGATNIQIIPPPRTEPGCKFTIEVGKT